jgi:DNA repair photolyase
MGANTPKRGRGASDNPVNRFESLAYERDSEMSDDELPSIQTQFFKDVSKSALSKNDSPDIPFKFSLNPYRGCEHGCIYCYARPTHEYLGFSAGLDFETRIMVKEDAPDLLRGELSSRKWEPQPIIVSGVTDPYQPIERKLELTRRCLEVFQEFRNPVAIITKNRLVARDVDILADLAHDGAAQVAVSVTTLNPDLARILEPRTSLPKQRLDTIRELSEAGVPVAVMMAPMIPGLNDSEIPDVLGAASEAGATAASYVMLRLPHVVAPLFEQWLDQHKPDAKDKILNRLRGMRGGDLYKAEFGKRMRGEGIHADQIAQLFEVASRKYGLDKTSMELSVEAFRRPGGSQMSLF